MKTYYECLACIINQTIKNLSVVEEKYRDDVLRNFLTYTMN